MPIRRYGRKEAKTLLPKFHSTPWTTDSYIPQLAEDYGSFRPRLPRSIYQQDQHKTIHDYIKNHIRLWEPDFRDLLASSIAPTVPRLIVLVVQYNN